MQKIKIFPLILLICLMLCGVAPSAYALDDPSLQAKAVLLADMNSGEILYSKNADERRSPASLTKIMTGLLAVEALESGQCRMDDMVTAGSDTWQGLSEDSSNSNIQPGEQMTYKDLLYCAIGHSANEACNVLATYIAGSIEAFVQMMNDRAAELGCTNTHFLDTNGLSNDGHYTTAYDLYLITREAMSHPDFVAICDSDYYKTQPTNMSGSREIYNSNALISNGGYYAQQAINNLGHNYLYEGASGVKTGYTRAAGYCLVSTAERNGIHVLAVVMGCGGELNTQEPEYGNFVDSIALYDWTFDNFSYRTLLSASQFSQKVTVDLADGDGSVILRPTEDIRALLPNDIDDASIATDVSIYEDKLVAPIEAGTELGEVRISAGGREYGVVKLVNPTAVELSRGEYIKQQLKSFFSKGWVIAIIVIVAVIAAAYLILVARYRRLRRRHLQERRRAEVQRRRAREQREALRQQQRYDMYGEDDYVPSVHGYDEEEPEEPRTDPSDLDELFSRYNKY